MRIAVCIPGFVRSPRLSLDTFKKHFIDVNKECEIDIYSCIWDLDGVTDPWHTIEDLRTDHICIWTGKISRLSDKKVDHEKYIHELQSLGVRSVTLSIRNFEEYSKEIMSTLKPFTINFNLSKTPYTLVSLKSKTYLIKETWNLIPDPYTYDYIVRIRTDDFFAEDFVLEKDILKVGKQVISFKNSGNVDNPHIQMVLNMFRLSKPTSEFSIIAPWRKHDQNNYLDEEFFIGKPKEVAVAMKIYDKIDYYIDNLLPLNFPGVEGETVFVAEMLANNININYFEKLPALSLSSGKLPALAKA
jgi:hypothetical protein